MGQIGKAHGIKGEMSLNWFGDTHPEIEGTIFLSQGGSEPVPYTITAVRFHNGRPIVRLAGINDRNGAESLSGSVAYMDRKDLPPLEEDETFLADLLDCDVLLPDNEPVGLLERIEYPANQQVWVIKDSAGREILFPAQPEFILKIDIDKKKIVIDPPPGLLEIYRA